MPKQRFAALDVGVLIRIRDGDEDAQAAFDWLQNLRVFPMASETVVQTLASQATEDADLDNRDAAAKTLACLPTWGILTPQLSDLNHSIAEITAEKFLSKRALPVECEIDALIIAEAAMEGCALLITDSEEILGATAEHLKLILLECHVSDVLIVSVDEIVQYLKAEEPESMDLSSGDI